MVKLCTGPTGFQAGDFYKQVWLYLINPLMKSVLRLQTLDSRDLNVSSVSVNQQLACFVLGPKHSFKGTPLVITLPFDLSR